MHMRGYRRPRNGEVEVSMHGKRSAAERLPGAGEPTSWSEEEGGVRAAEPRTRRGPDADTEGLRRPANAPRIEGEPALSTPWFAGTASSPRGANATAKRDDDALREAVLEALADALIDTRSMHVLVERGVVTLRGYVRNRYSKKLAVELAMEERGTARVVDELEVPELEDWAEQARRPAQHRS
jgi:hypothetical protein